MPPILVPIVWYNENDEKFLDTVANLGDSFIVLLIVDTGHTAKFGFPGAGILQGRELVEKVAKYLRLKDKKVEEIIEWGDTAGKMVHIAQMKNATVVIHARESLFLNQLKDTLDNNDVKFAVIMEEQKEPEQKKRFAFS